VPLGAALSNSRGQDALAQVVSIDGNVRAELVDDVDPSARSSPSRSRPVRSASFGPRTFAVKIVVDSKAATDCGWQRLELLARRYARGELSSEEYREHLDELNRSPRGGTTDG
jgi:hypothetical protein